MPSRFAIVFSPRSVATVAGQREIRKLAACCSQLPTLLLFMSEASTVIVSPPWPFKALFFLLGGMNALYFEFVIARRPDALPARGRLPRSVRRAGFASFTLWVLVIICGRLIPYITTWS